MCDSLVLSFSYNIVEYKGLEIVLLLNIFLVVEEVEVIICIGASE